MSYFDFVRRKAKVFYFAEVAVHFASKMQNDLAFLFFDIEKKTWSSFFTKIIKDNVKK